MSRTLERLSALDEAFFDFEGPRTPAHVGALAVFEGGPLRDDDGNFRLDEIRQAIESRLHLVPKLRQVVAPPPLGIHRPVWIDHAEFDIAHHVKLLGLPSPGDESALLHLCEQLHMELLDRTRPLWELWFVDGLNDGRIGLIQKIHHSIADGVTGVEIATALLDFEQDPSPLPPASWRPDERPSPMALFVSAAGDRVREPVTGLARIVARAAKPAAQLDAGRRFMRAAADLAGGPFRAPTTSLNQEIGTSRRFTVIRRDLASIKRAGHAGGATTNDVVLAAVAGGMRAVLSARGESLEVDRCLRALVPVSLHGDSHELGNQIGGIFADLPVGVADPADRLARISEDMRKHKEADEASLSAALLSGADLLPPRVASMIAGNVHRQHFVNLVVTNVPGVQVPLYAMGAKLEEVFPIVPLAGNLTLSVGVLSYMGQLNLGLYADRDSWSDLDVLHSSIEASFDQIEALA